MPEDQTSQNRNIPARNTMILFTTLGLAVGFCAAFVPSAIMQTYISKPGFSAEECANFVNPLIAQSIPNCSIGLLCLILGFVFYKKITRLKPLFLIFLSISGAAIGYNLNAPIAASSVARRAGFALDPFPNLFSPLHTSGQANKAGSEH